MRGFEFFEKRIRASLREDRFGTFEGVEECKIEIMPKKIDPNFEGSSRVLSQLS